MKAAAAQNYFPEWLSDGVALEDTDTVAQTFPANEAEGHLFGVAESPPQQRLFGPDLARRQAVPEADRSPDPARAPTVTTTPWSRSSTSSRRPDRT